MANATPDDRTSSVAQRDAGPAPTDPTARPSNRPGESFIGHANLMSRLTLVSRVFGLLRDKACSYYLGVGTDWSAFWMGFQFPNLFRRIFGEGALNAVFLPVYKRVGRDHGQPAADLLARVVATLLVMMFAVIIILGDAVLVPAIFSPHTLPANRLAAAMIALMLPYSLLICLTAFFATVASAHERFAAQSLAPVIVNILMILGAALPVWLFTSAYPISQRVFWVAGAVLVAGMLQVMLMAVSLRRVGVGIGTSWNWRAAGLRDVLVPMLPMIIGFSAVQLNTFMDSQIAWWLSPDGHGGKMVFLFLGQHVHVPMLAGALGKLSVAQRIYLLPVGVFGVATATAVFPKMSAAAAMGDTAELKRLLQQALRKSLFISVPTTIGMILIAPLLITAIYFGGRVTAGDVARAVWAARWFCAGIWAFELQMILLRVFYALRDVRTPMRVAVAMVALNFTLNLSLVWFMQEGGLAASTSLAAIGQCGLLLFILRRRLGRLGLASLCTMLAKALFCGGIMLLAAGSVDKGLSALSWLSPEHRLLGAWVRLPVTVLVALLAYGVSARLMAMEELQHVPILRWLSRHQDT